ncbi:PREDICTED: uncharacterized protein LOC105365850 [Ceratosolen solmsi marchali]|uniref:Uncharacterized protein LOC105365850 n=1 Tax=Ceratosolen solmsi marchali TaxID=326594 RepID=A0AAJ6YQL3_9HYME|nr:PREDICTED: uncharacterized protein LOC105365850 [Ceratosolen solmsi marchali]
MYRQIKVHEDDWDLQRILWVNENNEEVSYQLTTVTYGIRAAPFLAVRTLLQFVEDEGAKYPLAVPSIIHGIYVDDIFGSADTPGQLVKVALQLRDLCMSGGFPLAKWYATHKDVTTAVNASHIQPQAVTFDNRTTKILGLNWSPQQDIFSFTTIWTSRQDSKFMKRLILSEVAKVFDPLGFVSSVVIKAKIFMQELWLHKLHWDEALPAQLSSQLMTIRLLSTKIAWVFGRISTGNLSRHIHLCARFTWDHNHPGMLKDEGGPIEEVATLRMNIDAFHLWTDSRVTLAWMQSHPSKWKEFVINRVSSIQDLTPNAQWRFVPGISNPADCASRGITSFHLQEHPLWWNGPQWISNTKNWPRQPTPDDTQCQQEARPCTTFTATTFKPQHALKFHTVTSIQEVRRSVRNSQNNILRLRKYTCQDCHAGNSFNNAYNSSGLSGRLTICNDSNPSQNGTTHRMTSKKVLLCSLPMNDYLLVYGHSLEY